MKLVKARVQNYRSIIDTGEFTIEELKTILVGPNEAGKTVILQALQQLNKPTEIAGFNVIRDFPRAKYNDITRGEIDPNEVKVSTGWFQLTESEQNDIPSVFHDAIYVKNIYYDNKYTHSLENVSRVKRYKEFKNDFLRLVELMNIEFTPYKDSKGEEKSPDKTFQLLISKLNISDFSLIDKKIAIEIKEWIEKNILYIDNDNEKMNVLYDSLSSSLDYSIEYEDVLVKLSELVPVFVLFNNYFKVKPSIHLEHLAIRVEQKVLDDDYYDYGNLCLLKLLGFNPRELSDIGKIASPAPNNSKALQSYKEKLDDRKFRLNGASIKLTEEIREIWNPNPNRPEADKLRISADGQYLKVTVEDELGVEIELDQRSEGFQWLVSFFVVFFAEAMDKHKNAILLLDEPGMSLHGLKQRDFRNTISRLAENNQTIYTTHSPFLVGSDELDLVRVVELRDRKEGTRVHTTISSSDPAGLLPLQEALGYDLAQSLFTQQKNLVLEGLTDYWYIEATTSLLRGAKIKNANLDEKIALVFANTAGKVVYYATILHAQNMKVVALLDSDNAGDQAAKQEALIHTLGNKNILRTKDFCEIEKAEIEDLLRDTLILVVKKLYDKDIKADVEANPSKPILDIIKIHIKDLSKYDLAKTYVRWTREHTADDLSKMEKENWMKLIQKLNNLFK